MPQGGFKVLQDIGAIKSGSGSEIKFSVDEYRGHPYGSIRKYLKGDTYTGPTRSGVTMSPAIVTGILEALEKLPPEPTAIKEEEIGRYAKRPGLMLVARITIYMDSTGIDLREWQDDVSYKGWTKRGIRLPYDQLVMIKSFFAKMREAMPATE
ncbi:MAG: hypothetical protein WC421_08380 [Elusimicrobiales bacterium]